MLKKHLFHRTALNDCLCSKQRLVESKIYLFLIVSQLLIFTLMFRFCFSKSFWFLPCIFFGRRVGGVESKLLCFWKKKKKTGSGKGSSSYVAPPRVMGWGMVSTRTFMDVCFQKLRCKRYWHSIISWELSHKK